MRLSGLANGEKMKFSQDFVAYVVYSLITMPLFIDYHQFDRVTIDDIKSAHMADLAIQDEYGVKYHQFWVSE